MGLGGSKAATTAAATKIASATKQPPHIPSMPGKGGPDAAARADPLTGFLRGRSGVGTQREEDQRQFLQSLQQQQQTAYTNKYGGAAAVEYQDKLPDDLIKFMTDVGPLKRRDNGEPTGTETKVTTKRQASRLPRMPLISSLPSTLPKFVPPGTPATTSEPVLPTPKETPAAWDKTRKTENMRLAKHVAGFETARTTSFSNKTDAVDPNMPLGLDVIQLYGLVTQSVDLESFCAHPLPAAGIATTGDAASTAPTRTTTGTIHAEHRLLLEQSLKYLQVPMLLQDSDGSFVGAWPEQAAVLQQAHLGMGPVPTYQARLVLEDLWELEQQPQDSLAPTIKSA